jgi:aminoglycoside N3'-acetyltransferase
MGLLTELFRRTPKVKRSIHPTHSICALGPLANKLTANHHLAETTFGEGTPFGEMVKYNTCIVGIGTRNISHIHTAEDLLENKFPIDLFLETIPVTCLDELGYTATYNLKIRNPQYKIEMRFLNKILKGLITEWNFKGIPFYITNARLITDALIEAAKKGQTMYKKSRQKI